MLHSRWSKVHRSIEVMRFIFVFSFFVFFASLQPSWGRRPKRCGVGFKLSNEREKGRIIKISSSSSTTHAKWVKSVTTEFTMIVFCNFNFEGAHRNAFGMGIVAVMSSVQKRKGASYYKQDKNILWYYIWYRCILMSNYPEEVTYVRQEYIFCKRKSNAPRSRC